MVGPWVDGWIGSEGDATTACGSDNVVGTDILSNTQEVPSSVIVEDEEFDVGAVSGKKRRTTKLMTGKLKHEFFYDEHDPCWTVAEAVTCVAEQEGPSARTVDNKEVR